MLLNTRKLAFLGLLLALDVILIVLSGVIEMNTLFLLAAASFCVGIAIRESGKRIGFGFYLASILLGLILTPNKLYCITYAAFGLYLVIVENTYDKLTSVKERSNRRLIFWVVKYAAFNLMFLPILIFLPKLIYQGAIKPVLFALLILAGQVALFIFDKAYEYFQGAVWGKVRRRFKL